MGRKAKPKDEKTVRITISLSRDAERLLKSMTKVNRSGYISRLIIEDHLRH